MDAPLKFEPIFKTMLWGGTRLRSLFGRAPSDEPTGEAWLLSDVDGSESRTSDGRTLRELMAKYGEDLLGDAKPINGRFPLLIKLIDAKQELSVQVHPNDEQAKRKHPTAAGKTEAWVIMEANPATSRIYSGFAPGVTEAIFRKALKTGDVPRTLHQFVPQPGDCVFLRAGTVHAIGADILNFEVQQTSDITYRLYDWNRVDAKTGQPRQLHLDDALACSNFASGPCDPVVPKQDGERETLIDCEYFALDRYRIRRPVELPKRGCRIGTVIAGRGHLNDMPVTVGDTLLIPASLKDASLIPDGELEVLVSIPRTSS